MHIEFCARASLGIYTCECMFYYFNIYAAVYISAWRCALPYGAKVQVWWLMARRTHNQYTCLLIKISIVWRRLETFSFYAYSIGIRDQRQMTRSAPTSQFKYKIGIHSSFTNLRLIRYIRILANFAYPTRKYCFAFWTSYFMLFKFKYFKEKFDHCYLFLCNFYKA